MSLGQAEQFGGRMAGRNLTEGMVLPKESDIHPFEFNGNTKDYFGIWIVNVLLTIVTFGIYSCLLYTSPSPRDRTRSRMPSSA